MLGKKVYESPIGKLTAACEDESIVGLWIENQKYFEETILGKECVYADLPVLLKVGEWLDRYFAKDKPTPGELPLAPKGSEFRQRVWSILCEIPYGETVTYGEIAKAIAKEKGLKTMSAQAVGGAVGHNPISIIIPCHRVLGVNGSLTGYAAGVDIKKRLLMHEGANFTI